MAKKAGDEREIKARKFIVNSEKEFQKQFARDTVDDITISALNEKDGAYEATGSVAVTSPRGKQKTFSYAAEVAEDADGKFSFTKLQVRVTD